ncbi:hypothetical protein BcepSauron_268 [Burkholderia phage BcepSauron]|uniref:Uncharacterized protein n=1 Tax=Burkholderia phage BcepSauron TaxID=2530033 RepID=A0A482MLW6_9CAUD|nr:hypothetical protein H1O17_gp268 [Burkholderia phage BcepSauron]QBQ74648.1 hypothetical protein BcepSauron_268 [Burkholderia phage BcepSauron]
MNTAVEEVSTVQEQEPQPILRTYYQYIPVEVAGIKLFQYSGSKIQAQEGDQPANSTELEPPLSIGPTLCYYWDQDRYRWFWSPDLTKLDGAGAITRATAAADAAFSKAMAALNREYPEAERATWVQQRAAADAVLAGGTSKLLASMLCAGETAEELALKIATKADAYDAALGAALFDLRKARAEAAAATLDSALASCKTVEDLVNYAWASEDIK